MSLAITTPPLADDDVTTAELERLTQALETLQTELDTKEDTRSALEEKLKHAEIEIGELHAAIIERSVEITNRGLHLQSLVQEEKQLSEQRDLQRHAVDQQLLMAYTLNRENRMKLVLSQENPQRLARHLAYHDYLARNNQTQLQQAMADLRRLAVVKEELETETRALTAARADLAARERSLRKLQDERRETLAMLESDITDSRRKIETLERERAELESLLNSMSQKLSDREIDQQLLAFEAAKGKMAWPVDGPLKNAFGSIRGESGLRWHGVTIKAEAGSEVRAIHPGRVVYADWLRGSGLLLILDHGDGYMTLYAHNQVLLRETGEWVGAGELLARVGDTGGHQQAGLYFEIRHRGKPLDPVVWCKRRG